METLSAKDLSGLLEFAVGGAEFERFDAYAAYVVANLPRLIGCEDAYFYEFDIRSWRPVVLRAARYPVDGPAVPPEYRRLSHQSPNVHFFHRTARGAAVRWSDLMPAEDLHRKEIYDLVYRPLGMRSQIATMPSRSSRRMTVLALGRGSMDFSERDLRVADRLRFIIRASERRIRREERLVDSMRFLAESAEALGQAMIVLDHDRPRPTLVTRAAREFILRYMTWPRAHDLPSAVEDWLDGVYSRPGDTARNRCLVFRRGGKRLEIELLTSANPALPAALVLRETADRDAPQLTLTARESEVLAWVERGKTNIGIGTILSISARTVQKHLENIFAKLGAETRSEAVDLARRRGMPGVIPEVE